MNQSVSAVLFLESKALQSGRVVELLRRAYPEVIEAAAVYSETDVIGLVSASQGRLGDILLELMQRRIPDFDREYGLETLFSIDDIRVSLIAGKLALYRENLMSLNGQVGAYVLVQTDERQGTQSQVLRGLARCEGVILAAALIANRDVFVKVVAPNKISFDDKIMNQIQAVPGVKTTQSFIIINDKYFIRNSRDIEVNNDVNNVVDNVSAWAKQRG